MTPLTITADLVATPWDDLDRDNLTSGRLDRAGMFPDGTQAGKPSVGLLVELPDGQQVFAETTWTLFEAAYLAFRARYGPAR